MKQLSLSGKRLKVALWLVVALTLVVVSAGTLFAAGEELERSAVLSGGSTHSSNGFVMRDVIGLWAAGSSISNVTGVGLCTGFGCGLRGNLKPDDPDDPNDPGDEQIELYMPRIQDEP